MEGPAGGTIRLHINSWRAGSSLAVGHGSKVATSTQQEECSDLAHIMAWAAASQLGGARAARHLQQLLGSV